MSGRLHGSYPETGFAEIAARFPEPDFWPASRSSNRQWHAFLAVLPFKSRHIGQRENQSRRMRAGSVRLPRQAGKKHAANDTMIIAANAAPKASGSCGLTS